MMKMRQWRHLLLCRHFITSNGGGQKSGSQIPNLYSKITQIKPARPSVLSHEELTTINLLIPRLCLSDQVSTALHLAAASLPLLPNTNDAAESLSFSILAHSLTFQSDMALPMSLLTILSHSEPSRAHLPRIGALLVASYLRKGRPLEALKVYKWLTRREYPVGGGSCRILVCGLMEGGLVAEALRVVKKMVEAGVVPGGVLRRRIYMGLLKEAVVQGAIELDRALLRLEVENDDEELRFKKVGDLLDSAIAQLD